MNYSFMANNFSLRICRNACCVRVLIKENSFGSSSTQHRENEKAKLDKAFQECDRKLDGLLTREYWSVRRDRLFVMSLFFSMRII